MDKTFKEVWLEVPDSQMAEVIKDIIREKWDDEPSAIQILEAIDYCVHYGASSDFVVSVLDGYMHAALQCEGKTFEELISEATWRNGQ